MGLGGDSRVQLAGPTASADEPLLIGPERVTPLAQLAAEHETVAAQLHAASRRPLAPEDAVILDYWYLVRHPQADAETLTAPERELLDALAAGPLNLPALLERLGVPHLRLVPWQRLVRRGVVARAGFTPTDAMHATCAYEPWNREASLSACRALGSLLGRPPDEVPRLVFEVAARALARCIVAYLAPRADGTPGGSASGWMEEGALRPGSRDSWPLVPHLRLDVPIVAVGGAGPVLLSRVAEILHTECLVPPHHEVASAVGAAVAKPVARYEAWVYPAGPAGGFLVSVNDTQAPFYDEETALAHARKAAARHVRDLAVREGLPASSDVYVSVFPEGGGYRVVAALEAGRQTAGLV